MKPVLFLLCGASLLAQSVTQEWTSEEYPSCICRDDGRYFAFIVPAVGEAAGAGHGIYVFDLQAASSGSRIAARQNMVRR